MYKILKKTLFSENVIEYVVEAKDVAKASRAGQFIILIVEEGGERVPFTICSSDKDNGTVTILVQTIGATTMKLAKKNQGDYISNFVGPLGKPTELDEFKKVLLIGGGIGCAVIAPQAIALNADKKSCDAIIGARNKDLIVYEQVFKANCSKTYVMTDDGSAGEKGFVTNKLRELIEKENHGYDAVFAVGPLPMMRAVVAVTKEFGLKTIISMNSIMVDGTGMCGCCRLTVGGKTKYACVDGPEFDGHLVDFEEAINRSRSFVEIEKDHVCRLTGKQVNRG